MWRLSIMLVNNQWVTEGIMKKFFLKIHGDKWNWNTMTKTHSKQQKQFYKGKEKEKSLSDLTLVTLWIMQSIELSRPED